MYVAVNCQKCFLNFLKDNILEFQVKQLIKMKCGVCSSRFSLNSLQYSNFKCKVAKVLLKINLLLLPYAASFLIQSPGQVMHLEKCERAVSNN